MTAVFRKEMLLRYLNHIGTKKTQDEYDHL